MTISLLHHTPLWIAAQAIRTCWQSQDKSDTTFQTFGSNGIVATQGTCGPVDRALIDRIGNQFKHASTLEHITYNFKIEGVSRALLQELARHRMASYSVKSSRYTLKELKNEPIFKDLDTDKERASKYLVWSGDPMTDYFSFAALENLRKVLTLGSPNDRAKYCMPEAYKTEIAWTINARSLQNFLHLRSSKAALWEIRDLANAIYAALPADHQYLFTQYLQGETHDTSTSTTNH